MTTSLYGHKKTKEGGATYVVGEEKVTRPRFNQEELEIVSHRQDGTEKAAPHPDPAHAGRKEPGQPHDQLPHPRTRQQPGQERERENKHKQHGRKGADERRVCMQVGMVYVVSDTTGSNRTNNSDNNNNNNNKDNEAAV